MASSASVLKERKGLEQTAAAQSLADALTNEMLAALLRCFQ